MDPRLLRRSRATRGAIAVLVLIGTLQAGAIIAQAWLLATVVADLVGGGSLADHGRDLLLLGATFGVRGLLAAAQQRTAHRASAAVKSALREELLQARLARPFDADTSGGALLDLATRGVEALDGWFAGYLPQLVLAVLVPSVVGLAIGLADPTSLLVVVLTLPLIPVFMVLVGLVTRDRLDARWRAGAGLAHHFADLVTGLGTLQVFGRARAQVAGLRRIEQRHEQATLQTLRVAFLSALVLELLATLSVALVAVGIGLRVVDGDLTLFVGLLVLVLAPEVYLPLRQVGARYHDAADGMAAAEQAFTLIDAAAPGRADQAGRAERADQAGRADQGGAVPQAGSASRTVVRDHRGTGSGARSRSVRDWHPPRLGAITAGVVRVEGLRLERAGRVVVSDLSFWIGPGEVVAVAGPSGAGKSSLLVALLGHLRPEAGCIRVDRTPLDELDPERWRRHVAWVGQQPDLWPATVAENVLLGAPAATTSAVRAALDRAGAAALGLDQSIAPDGTGLSAGEQRRVALARALLAIDVGGARMLVLDEPTAGLDVDTEATVIAGLRATGVSVLVVSHRAAVLAAADHVVHLPRLGPRPSSAVMVSPHEVGGRPIDRTRRPDPSVAGRGHTGSAALPDTGPTTRTTGLTVRASALAIGAAAAGVGLMATAAWLLARASEQPPVLYLLVAVTLVRFFGLSRGVLRYLDRLAAHRLGLRHQAAARIRSYAGLAGSAVVGRPLGELVARLVLDTEAAQDQVVRVRLPVVAAWTLGVVVALGAGLLVPAAGLLLAAYLVLLGLVWPVLAASVSARSDARLATLRGELAEQVLLVHRHAVLLHTTGQQQAGLAELRRVDVALRRAERRAATSRGLGQLAGWVSLGVVLPALLVVGGRAVAAGELAPILLAVLALTPLALQELLLPLVDSFGLRRPTRAALARVAELASTPPAVGAAPQPLPEPRLRLESLVVGRERPLLAPVSLDVGPGERVVLVGPSGVGKSTLVATLLGQLAPHAGTVSVGGRLGCLTQDAHLFDTTVAENLRIGRPEASDADVEGALAAVGLDLDPARMIGEHGSGISGGEARRVALARLLLAEPATVMIDEPTEHLDADTARALLCDVDAIWSRAPVVAVSHQPEVFLEAWGSSVTVVPVYPVGSSMMSVGTL